MKVFRTKVENIIYTLGLARGQKIHQSFVYSTSYVDRSQSLFSFLCLSQAGLATSHITNPSIPEFFLLIRSSRFLQSDATILKRPSRQATERTTKTDHSQKLTEQQLMGVAEKNFGDTEQLKVL